MAIEIRELVIRATVVKRDMMGSENEFVSKSDLIRFQDKVSTQLLRKMKNLIEESRSSR